MTREVADLSHSVCATVLTQAHLLGATHATLFGYGEPSMDAALPSKIEFAARMLGMEVFITSNGQKMDATYARTLLKKGLSYIRFSVHGVDERHDKVQPPTKFGRVIENINIFLQTRAKLKATCGVGIYAMPMHGETVEEIVKFWEPFEIDHLEIWRPHNWASGREYRARQRNRKKTCGRPFNGPIQVLSDGRVVPCCFDFDGHMVMGDVHHQSLYAILTGKRYEALRQNHTDGKHGGTLCDQCDQLNADSGDVLLYSSRDPHRRLDTTSTWKVSLTDGHT